MIVGKQKMTFSKHRKGFVDNTKVQNRLKGQSQKIIEFSIKDSESFLRWH
jgi:hypothetical protein